jgi:hypothetical protein
VGGLVIDALNDQVVLGFQIVLCASSAIASMTSSVGYRVAMQERNRNAAADIPDCISAAHLDSPEIAEHN